MKCSLPERVANDEYEHYAHEDDGQVVLLLPPGLLGGRGRVPAHAHLPAVAVLHVLVDLEKKRTKRGGGSVSRFAVTLICLKIKLLRGVDCEGML